MVNKKDLRGGIEKMRAVAQLLSEWANDLESTLPKKAKKEPSADETVPAETPAAHPESEPAVSPAVPETADVRALLAAKCAQGFRAQVQALINSYGAEKFSEVNPEHYPELVAAVNRLDGDGNA